MHRCMGYRCVGPYVARLSLHHFFDWRWVTFSNFTGWMVIIAFSFNALAAAAYLVVVVRLRMCFQHVHLT